MLDFLTITCHNAYNYGAVLQTYGLYKYLTSTGLSGKVIDYRPSYKHKTDSKNLIKKFFRPILRFIDFHKSEDIFNRFLYGNINFTTKVSNSEEIIMNIEIPRVYITGSDQVWNCNTKIGNDNNYFLSFADGEKVKKTSYAASIAMDGLNVEQSLRFKKLLSDFSNISVRENTAIELLKKIGISNVEQVLDPVFLLHEEEWMKLINQSKLKDILKKEKYVLLYGFLRKKNVYKYAKELARRKKIKLFNVNTVLEDFFCGTDKYFWNIAPEDFLALIYYSQDIVTNSFHGLSFSLIFKKNFHLFGKTEDSNSRMFDLVHLIGLDDRIIRDGSKILDDNIDYKKVEKTLEKNISLSKEYLFNIFKNEEKNEK